MTDARLLRPTEGAAVRAAARRRAERALFERYRRDPSPAVRAELVERFLPLARQLARRCHNGEEPLDDLVQVASEGLLKAIERFDLDRATAFSSFAVPTILGELKRHFRDKGWSVRVPRDLQELTLRVERIVAEYTLANGRAPSVTELAEDLGVTVEEIHAARMAHGAHRAGSLDRPADNGAGDSASVGDTIGATDPGFDHADDAMTIGLLLSALDDRDREVLRLRFGEDLTQSQIGARIGVSQMHVSRLIRRALTRLEAIARDESTTYEATGSPAQP